MAEKVYYTIGEVAKMFEVNTSLIRFWEKEFDILKPHKNKKGNRLFTKNDVDNIRMIHHLVKERGYTLQGARDKLSKNASETESEKQLITTLEDIKGFLKEIRKDL
jgi:DNA-binding transcriptional MerR regulator